MTSGSEHEASSGFIDGIDGYPNDQASRFVNGPKWIILVPSKATALRFTFVEQQVLKQYGCVAEQFFDDRAQRGCNGKCRKRGFSLMWIQPLQHEVVEGGSVRRGRRVDEKNLGTPRDVGCFVVREGSGERIERVLVEEPGEDSETVVGEGGADVHHAVVQRHGTWSIKFQVPSEFCLHFSDDTFLIYS